MIELQAILSELYLDSKDKTNLQKASKILASLEQDLGDNPIVYQLKARYALTQNSLVEAIKFLEKADSLSGGKNFKIKLLLAELYLRQGEIGAARKEIDSARQLNPGNIRMLRLSTDIYLRLRQNTEALRFAEQILSYPGQENNVSALLAKLECYARMNRLEEADGIAAKLQKLGVKLNWKVQKAKLLMARGNFAQAEKLLKEFLVESPGDKTASLYLVNIYARNDKIEDAKKVLKAAQKKEPDNPGYKRLMELLSIKNKTERMARLNEMKQELTKESMTKKLESAKGEKDKYLRAIRLFQQYRQLKDMDNARKYLKQALKLDRKRATPSAFQFAIEQQKWNEAQQYSDFAKVENLDQLKGLRYESLLTNARGWSFINEGKNKQAKEYFAKSATASEQIISELPNESQTRALLGEAYFWLGRKEEASTQIRKAIELNPFNPYALRALSLEQWYAITAASSPNPKLVRAFAINISRASKLLPNDKWLAEKKQWLTQQAKLQKQYQLDIKGDIKEVLARREKIRKEEPENTQNILRLAWVYENRKEVKDIEKAEKCFQQALQVKQAANILELYGGFAQRNHRMKEAEKFLTTLAKQLAQKNNGDGYSLLAFFYLNLGEIEKSEQAFLETVKVQNVPTKRLDVAVFYNRIGNHKKTAEWARKALKGKITPERGREARSLLINALMALREWNQAEEQISEFLKVYEGDPQGKIFQARLSLEKGDMSEALSILNQMLEKNPEDMTALNLRSTVYLYTWRLEEALADMETMERIDNRAFGLSGRIRMIKLGCELGKSSEAEVKARELISQASRNFNLLDNIRIHLIPALQSALNAREYEELLVWAGNLQKEYWGWPFERGKNYLNQNKYSQAQKALSEAWSIVQNAPPRLKRIVMNVYMDAMFKGRSYQKMDQIIDKNLKDFEKSLSWLLAWKSASLYAQGQKSKATQTYLKALESAGENLILIVQMTQKTILKAVDAKECAGLLGETVKTAPKLNKQIKLTQASCYFEADQIDKGVKLYNQLISEEKDKKQKAILYYLLGQAYTPKHKYSEAVKALEETLKFEPENVAVLNNLAYILAEYLDKPEQGAELIKKARNIAPSNPDLLDTYGQILVKTGQPDLAMQQMAKSVWIRESAASRYHLGLILLEQGRKADAQIQLNRALNMVTDDKKLERQIREALNKI